MMCFTFWQKKINKEKRKRKKIKACQSLVVPDASGMSNEELKFQKGQISIVILEELHVLNLSHIHWSCFSFSNMALRGNLEKDPSNWCSCSQPQKLLKEIEQGHREAVFKDYGKKLVPTQPKNTHKVTRKHAHAHTRSTKWINCIAWKTTPATGS